MNDKHNKILCSANSYLTALLWQIGTELSGFIQSTSKNGLDEEIEVTISQYLIQKYHPFFTLSNLQLLIRFARKLTNSDATQLGFLYSWEDIRKLLESGNIEKDLGALKFLLQKGISPYDLKKRNPDLPEFLTGDTNVFKGPFSSLFKALFQLEKIQNESGNDEVKHESIARLINQLNEQLLNYRTWANVSLQLHLNLLFHEVGRYINENISLASDGVSRDLEITRLSTELMKSYGFIFSSSELSDMTKFAAQFPNENVFISIAQTVSWKHIKSILNLEGDLSAKIFYLKMVADEGLTPDELKIRVSDNLYERTSGAQDQIQTTVEEMLNPQKDVVIEQDEHGTVTTNHCFIGIAQDEENPQLSANIFDDPYFVQFALSS